MNQFLSHVEDYGEDLRALCFEFFYWFSRFEYALKERGYVKAGRYGEAQVAWGRFASERAGEYSLSTEAKYLVEDPPQSQKYINGHCGWEETELDREKTELGKVLLVVKTIRNNLFHGGKASQKDWDDPSRNMFLLRNGKAVIDNLAQLAEIESDYLRRY